MRPYTRASSSSRASSSCWWLSETPSYGELRPRAGSSSLYGLCEVYLLLNCCCAGTWKSSGVPPGASFLEHGALFIGHTEKTSLFCGYLVSWECCVSGDIETEMFSSCLLYIQLLG